MCCDEMAVEILSKFNRFVSYVPNVENLCPGVNETLKGFCSLNDFGGSGMVLPNNNILYLHLLTHTFYKRIGCSA